ncbi:MAG: hypothetical protein HYX78_01090 [Armatimonadetes bacterium]|nr:hypothetical protein [Armatimonadota bacterium]
MHFRNGSENQLGFGIMRGSILGLVVVLLGMSPLACDADSSDIKTSALPGRLGSYYEATVPDTLDLAERAKLGINHFTSIISPKDDYEMYWTGGYEANHTQLTLAFPSLTNVQPEAWEALTMERLMCGSKQNLDRETGMVNMLASHLGEEGIYWVFPDERKPWLIGEIKKPYAHMYGQGAIMLAMIIYCQYTGDPVWKMQIDRMVDAMGRILVVHKDDYAYFPTYGAMREESWRSCYVKGVDWVDKTEPQTEKGGEEGSMFLHQGRIAGVLAQWYTLTGNKQALKLSGELVRFLTKTRFWADHPGGEYPGVFGSNHAHWTGRAPGHYQALTSILEYAIATNDSRLKEFVRDGYEWSRQYRLPRLGFIDNGEGCAAPRLMNLAIKLSYANVGDYWEDVDLYIRNNPAEYQFTPDDVSAARQLVGNNPRCDPPKIDAIQAAVGAVPAGINERGKALWWLCCTSHGNLAFYYAWDATLRYDKGVAQINLLLNRASPWMDIDSYLPYEGKVVLKNKKAKEALVRIPLWVDKEMVKCRVGKKQVDQEWFGRYLRVRSLKPGDIVTIEFPVRERTEQWIGQEWIPAPQIKTFDLKFRGNTLVEISPEMFPVGCTFYKGRAEQYRAQKARMKKVTRFVTPLILKW